MAASRGTAADTGEGAILALGEAGESASTSTSGPRISSAAKGAQKAQPPTVMAVRNAQLRATAVNPPLSPSRRKMRCRE